MEEKMEFYPRAVRKAARPLLISFSGLDGSGKSTQIENLRNFLEARAMRTRVLAFWDDVVVLPSWRESAVHNLFGSERGVGVPGSPVNRRDKNVRAWYLTLLRHLLYFLDAVHSRVVLWRVRDADAVIFDRYIYDELVNLSLANPLTSVFVWVTAAIAPRPSLAYLLDADPEAARARKPEYPVDFLQRSRMNYYRLAARLKTLTLVPPLPQDKTCRAVEGALLQVLEGNPGAVSLSQPGMA
jgi:thymidylate kinase